LHPLFAQELAQEGERQEPPPGFERPGRGGEPQIKPYEQVITKEAKSDEGIFTVHRVKEKVYYEIPKSELGKDFLWVSQIAKTTLGVGYGGQALGNRIVRWQRTNNRVLLRSVSYEIVADPKLPIYRAVEAANNNAIVMAFNIEALGKDEAPVIDVSRLFTTEVTEFSAVTDDQRPFIRGELQALSQSIAGAMAKATDRATRLHLQDARDQIAKALDPKFLPPAPATGTQPFGGGRPGDGELNDSFDENGPAVCWPDYAIRRSDR
jgi:hypothetical protein